MIIYVYKIADEFYEIVSHETLSNGQLLASGEHEEVFIEIKKMLAVPDLDMGDNGFGELTNGSEVGTIGNSNKWLLSEIIENQKARLFKNPQGVTQTKLKTWLGSLNEVMYALYEYIDEIDKNNENG